MATAKLKVELHPPSPVSTAVPSFMSPSGYGYNYGPNMNIPPGAIFMAPVPYQHNHTHITNEPCRNCLGCMPNYGYVPPASTQPPQTNHSNYRSGAWNHGMLGPNRNSHSSKQHNWR